MLIDELEIIITAGHGGAGKYAPVKEWKSASIPGDGGSGGNVYISATTDLSALTKFSGLREIRAADGNPGGDNDRSGGKGPDTEIQFPIGTSVIDTQTGQTVAELTNVDQHILLCAGGLGGQGGNFRAQGGLPGQTIHAKLVLKLIAKYGFIGLPNAGKSSLLNELTNARAAVGNYAFTTLEPNLGVLHGQVIADIPGLIEGASVGRGLGIKFLKHIEKVSLLVHCIACDSQDVVADYNTVSQELTKFGQGLDVKPRIIVLTKTDLVDAAIIKKHLALLKKFKHQIITVSIHDFDALTQLKKILV